MSLHFSIQWLVRLCSVLVIFSVSVCALAEEQDWNIHAQFTNVTQYHSAFDSPYQGPNSLSASRERKSTNDITVYAGLRTWSGGALYINPEIDQGFGISNTLGVAGFPNGEAYKIGQSDPYFKLQRLFFRQTIGFGDEMQQLEDLPNQLSANLPQKNFTFTLGKFSVVDIFDANKYAHDPKNDFLNWSLLDAGALDYAANAWGYTYGGALELNMEQWSIRAGVFALSREPNSKFIDTTFKQHSLMAEIEDRIQVDAHPGKVKLLLFANQGNMASYKDAVTLSTLSGFTPDVSKVRTNDLKMGLALNVEQELRTDLGAFARASLNDGTKETFEFTDINHSLSLGLSLKGAEWGRKDDCIGIASVVNGISSEARNYFAKGGLGLLVGDGQLKKYGNEKIIETYYSAQVFEHLALAMDYQYVANPAYNRERGPVSIFGLRVHSDF